MRRTLTYSAAALFLIACGGGKKTTDYSFLYEEKESIKITEKEENSLEEAQALELIYNNHIYQKSIHTALLHPLGFELGEPILTLNSQEQLLLSFDELENEYKDYYYTLIHCNADWTPSDLVDSEYLEGFMEVPINNYESSFNTIQHYIHYDIALPSLEMKPLLSGNYLVVVFEEGKREQPILSKRMMLLDKQLSIEGTIKRPSSLEQRNYQHEIDFKVLHPGYEINNPFQNIRVVLTQNSRWDNAIRDLQPIFVKTDELIYDYEEENLFDGGNEYRFFDSKSLRYFSERIRNIEFIRDTTHVELHTDSKRSFQRYSNLWQDLNGKKYISVQEGKVAATEADYTLVHFTLPYEHEITHGSLYVFGQISDYTFPETHRMHYNKSSGNYEASIYLKQGFYNYEYVLKKQDGEAISRFIEGTHYETRNDYRIFIYHRPAGELYDQLIGIQKMSSEGIF